MRERDHLRFIDIDRYVNIRLLERNIQVDNFHCEDVLSWALYDSPTITLNFIGSYERLLALASLYRLASCALGAP